MNYQKILHPNTGLESNVVKRNDGAIIPFDPENTDYQAYLLWISEGNVPTPADEAVL